MATSEYDAIVIGGGPGGSTAAALLARGGRRVLLLERERFPRFRIGESMLPMVREIYERLGVAEEIETTFIRKYGAHFVKGDGSREWTYEFKNAMDCPYEYAFQVERAEHDRILLENARRAGADVREGWQVDDVLFEGDRAVGVRASEIRKFPNSRIPEAVDFHAPFTIDASGRWSVIAKKLRLQTPDPRLNKAAAFSHYRGVERLPGKHEGTITVATFEGGWIWVIPFKGEITSVGAVMHRDYWRRRADRVPALADADPTGARHAAAADMLDAAIAACPPVARRMARAERVRPVTAEGSFSYRASRFAGPGWVLCGDAAAFMDPIFSSGVLITMRSAVEIAETIERGLARGDTSAALFARYERRMRRGMNVFFKFIYGFYDEAFLELFLQPTNSLGLVNAITGVLAGNLFPGMKFKVRIWAMDWVVRIARVVYRVRGRRMRSLVGS